MKKLTTLIATLVFFSITKTQSLALDKTIFVSQDSYTSNLFINTNNGENTQVQVQYSSPIGTTSKTYFDFDLSTLPENITVTKAVFIPYLNGYQTCSSTSLSPLPIDIFKVTSSWNESTITYMNSPTFNSTPLDTKTILSVQHDSYISFDITQTVKKWYSGEEDQHGVMLKYNPNANSNNCVAKFASKETTGRAPYSILVVTYLESLEPIQLNPVPQIGIRDIVKPKLSGMTAYDITGNGAKVKWTTDENATSYVTYGESTTNTLTTGNSNLVKDHFVTLSGLNPGTNYTFKIISKDSSGNESTSAFFTFKTVTQVFNANSENPHYSPVILNVIATVVNTREVKITWQTDTDSSSWVFLDSQATRDTELSDFRIVRGINNSVKQHEIVVDHLSPGLTYYFRVFSLRDEDNQSYSILRSFKVPALGAFTGQRIELPESPVGTAEQAGVSSNQDDTVADDPDTSSAPAGSGTDEGASGSQPSDSGDSGDSGNSGSPDNSNNSGTPEPGSSNSSGDGGEDEEDGNSVENNNDDSNNNTQPPSNQNNVPEDANSPEQLQKDILEDIENNKTPSSVLDKLLQFSPLFGGITWWILPLLLVLLILLVIFLVIKKAKNKGNKVEKFAEPSSPEPSKNENNELKN